MTKINPSSQLDESKANVPHSAVILDGQGRLPAVDGSLLTNVGGGNSTSPRWTKYPFSYTDLSDPTNVKLLTLAAAPSRVVFHKIGLLILSPMEGPGLTVTAVDPKLGTDSLTGLPYSVSVAEGVSSGDQVFTLDSDAINTTSYAQLANPGNINVQVTSTGCNLNALTAGSFVLCVLASGLPA